MIGFGVLPDKYKCRKLQLTIIHNALMKGGPGNTHDPEDFSSHQEGHEAARYGKLSYFPQELYLTSQLIDLWLRYGESDTVRSAHGRELCCIMAFDLSSSGILRQLARFPSYASSSPRWREF